MLKIKDNVDLKELENFIEKHNYKEVGIWRQYNINTGELEKVWIGKKWNDMAHSYRISYDNDDKIIQSAQTQDLDLLYDLIKDGLVEKVD